MKDKDSEQKIRFGEYARLKRIEVAATTVLHGLNQRIDAAPDDAKPVFHGIAELHSALQPAE